MKFYKKIIIFNAIALILFISAGGWIIVKFNEFVHTSASQTKNKVYIDVKSGENVYSIIKTLKEKGIITRTDWFYYYVRLSSAARKIKAGVHLFYTDYTPKEVLNELENSSVYSKKITIIEGWSDRKIAKVLTDNGFDGAEFLKLAQNPPLAKKLTGLSIDTLEGFMYPDTYYLKIKEKPINIIYVMFDRFESEFYDVAKRHFFTMMDYKKLIVASIIEKETNIKKDKPLVASVIYNRLKKKMPLQMDSTVIYGIKDFNGHLTKKEIKNKDNRYNTYVYAGLPKNPICNPSSSSLKAAYNPAKTDYLYFVAQDNGSSVFSKTLKEHNRWIRRLINR